MKKVVLLGVFFVFTLVVIMGSVLFNITYNLDFKLIDTIKNEDIPEVTSRPIWLSIRDEKYNGFYSQEYFENYGIDTEELDTDNYTYIATFGYKLNKISFSPAKRNYTSSFLLNEYTGIVDLDSTFSKEIYIYQIKKLNIDCGSSLTKDVLTYDGEKSFDEKFAA